MKDELENKKKIKVILELLKNIKNRKKIYNLKK